MKNMICKVFSVGRGIIHRKYRSNHSHNPNTRLKGIKSTEWKDEPFFVKRLAAQLEWGKADATSYSSTTETKSPF